MAEIRMERTQSNVLTWFLGLTLLTLVILGMVLVAADSATGADTGGAREVVNPQGEEEKEKDETPRRLQQWAFSLPAAAGGSIRAA